MQTKRLVFATLLAVAATGCGDSAERALTRPDGAKPRLTTAASVNVCCSTTLSTGGTGSVFADVYDANGQLIANPSVTWSSSNNSVVSVHGTSRNASIVANGVGNAVIYASVNGVTGSTTVQVQAVPVVAAVQLMNTPMTLQMSQQLGVSARALDQFGNPVNGATFTYSIQNTSVATITSSGLITALSAGTTTVTVTSNGVSATGQVTVLPGITVSFSGPSTIWSEGSYNWEIQASGGTGSYTYQWHVDYLYGPYNDDAGTSSTAGLYVSGNTGPFIIRVVVTSGSATSGASQMVCNFIEGANC